MIYCSKYNVQLCADKTKLVAMSTKEAKDLADYAKIVNPINIDDSPVEFADSAEHVGIIRSESGNLPNLFNRILAHKRALGATLTAGLAQAHRANPIAGLKVQQMYGTPVLLSGLGALVLNSAEIQILNQHCKVTIEGIQKLLPRTPPPVVFFLGGSLPGKALLHLRQLNLFGMICRRVDNVLHQIAESKLIAAKTSSKSWFLQVRELCLLYRLPHPLDLLKGTSSKEAFNKLVKAHVFDYWEKFLRTEASSLPSLEYFNPNFMSLKHPHPIWTSAKSNP